MKLFLFIALTAFLVQASAWPPLKNPSPTEQPLLPPPLDEPPDRPPIRPPPLSTQSPTGPPTAPPTGPPTVPPIVRIPVPLPKPPTPVSCDVPSCSGLQIYLQPTHEPTQFFQCTLLGQFVVASCPIGLVFNYSQQTCVLPSDWENHC